MIHRARPALVLWLLLIPVYAAAQTTPAPSSVPATGSRLWIVAGTGFATTRAGCATCDRSGVFLESRSLLVDAGIRISPRVDAGIELMWVGLKVGVDEPVRTTFVLGVAQVRPWATRGLFLRAGMGIGVAGNGLSGKGTTLAPPYTTNALAITYGTGWIFRPERRWTVQVHASHHVAALGTLITVNGIPVQSVVGNYWTVGAAIVIRQAPRRCNRSPRAARHRAGRRPEWSCAPGGARRTSVRTRRSSG